MPQNSNVLQLKSQVNHLQSIDLRLFSPFGTPAHPQSRMASPDRASGVSVPLALLSAVPVAGQAPRKPWSRCLVGSTHFEVGPHSIHSSPPTRGNRPEIWENWSYPEVLPGGFVCRKCILKKTLRSDSRYTMLLWTWAPSTVDLGHSKNEHRKLWGNGGASVEPEKLALPPIPFGKSEAVRWWDSCCWLVLISWCCSNWRHCLHPTKDVWDKPDKHCRNRQKMWFRYAPEIWCTITKTGIEETSKKVPLWGFMTKKQGRRLKQISGILISFAFFD